MKVLKMKSKEKIEQLKQALEQELESLPDKNAFGDSNARIVEDSNIRS